MAYCHHAIIFLELVDIFTCTEIMDIECIEGDNWHCLLLYLQLSRLLIFNKIYMIFYISDIKLSVVVLS